MTDNYNGWFRLANTPPINAAAGKKRERTEAEIPKPKTQKEKNEIPIESQALTALPEKSQIEKNAPQSESPVENQSLAALSEKSPPHELHSQTVGPRGPVLIQDTVLHETLEEFAFSPSIPRVVHTKGYGAFGFFRPFTSMREYTAAGFLQDSSITTPVAVRFSLAASDNSTPDTSRNIRGFSVKFYTKEGIFDLLSNSIPVFFVRDSIKVPATIAALSPSPINNLPDPNLVWGMFARTPEATNLLIWFFSDTGTAKSFRTIRFYGVSTFVWKNTQGVRRYIKYHWLPVAKEEYIDQQEAAKLACENPNIAGWDLYNTIAAKNSVEFNLAVQVMNPADEIMLPFDPLDDTKIWDEKQYPLISAGRLTLNRNPDNFSEQVEKLAFAPANLVEGIEFSDDKMLQGRAIVYSDAQRHRLGRNFRKIPVNRQPDWSPLSMVTSGDGRFVEGKLVRSQIPKPDDFTQAGERYKALSEGQRQSLAENLGASLSEASIENQQIIINYLRKASPQLAEQVNKQLQQRTK